MFAFLDAYRDLAVGSVVLRLVLAFVCGMAIGFERSYKNRPAGLRTHILICVGAAAASLTGLFLYLGLKLPSDVSRIGSHVVSGLGFIGAGTIIVTGTKSIKGLTTAAGLWTTGIIGLAIGAGYYEGGVLTTALVLIVETLVAEIGGKIKPAKVLTVLLRYSDKLALDEVMRYCKDKRFAVLGLRVTSRSGGDAGYAASLTIRSRRKVDEDALIEHIRTIPDILEAEYE